MTKVDLIFPRGFCFGVERALKLLDEALSASGPVYVLHEIVHNTVLVNRYRAKGARFVEGLDDVPDGSILVFSAHGVSRQIKEQAKQKKCRCIDTTCPFVMRIHQWVTHLEKEDCPVVLIGQKAHAETAGTLGQLAHPEKAFVVENEAEADALPPADKIGVAVQTTFNADKARRIQEKLAEKYPTVLFQKGICSATQERQDAVKEACKTHATILVVGDKKSSNARRLVEVAVDAGRHAFLIETPADLAGLKLTEPVGLTAASSASEDVVMTVFRQLTE